MPIKGHLTYMKRFLDGTEQVVKSMRCYGSAEPLPKSLRRDAVSFEQRLRICTAYGDVVNGQTQLELGADPRVKIKNRDALEFARAVHNPAIGIDNDLLIDAIQAKMDTLSLSAKKKKPTPKK